MIDIHAAIGSNTARGTLQFTAFVPSVDRDGQPIDHSFWVNQVLATFGTLFRGATAFPPGRGVWRDDARAGTLVFDDTVMVTAYVDPVAVTNDDVSALRRLLHRLGREARQGEVGIVIGTEYHGITRFDPSEGGAA